MNFPTAVKTCFRKWWNTSDRAARKEFWYWQLFINIAALPLDMVDMQVFHDVIIGPCDIAFSAVTFLPSLFVMARRLHDVDRSFYWTFLSVTLIGIIPLLYWFCKKGTAGENRFGADPL